MGLYVAPHLPGEKVRNAVGDYAGDVHPEDVVALYDATLMGSGKDGAVFTSDRLVFQNNNLEQPQSVAYVDIVSVSTRKKLLGGQKLMLEVNRGRATIELSLDFSGKPAAAEFVARFLNEALQRGAAAEMDARPGKDEPAFPRPGIKTDLEAVRAALDELHEQELLSADDWHKMRRAVGLE